MAPITGSFEANFDSFYIAGEQAVKVLESMRTGLQQTATAANDFAGSFKVSTVADTMTAASKKTVAGLDELGSSLLTTKSKAVDFIEGFNLTALATRPLETATQGVGALNEILGPTGVTMGLVTAAATAAGAALVGLGVSTANAAAAIGDASDTTGLAVPTVSRYANAFAAAGSDLQTFTSLMFTLQKGVGEGSEKFDAGLKKIGLSVDQLRQTNPGDWMAMIAKGFADTEDPARRAAAAVGIFDKQGKDILPTLKQLNTAMEATAAITPFTQEQAEQAEVFQRQLAVLKLEFGAMAQAIGVQVVPVLTSFLEGTRAAAAGIAGLAGAVANLGDWVITLRDLDQGVSGITLPAVSELDAVTAGMTKWKQSVTSAALAVPTLNEALTLQVRALKDADAATAAQVAQQKAFTAAMEEYNSAGQSVTATLAGLSAEQIAVITYGLEAGVSMQALGTISGATDVQIKAVGTSMKEFAATLKDVKAIESARYSLTDIEAWSATAIGANKQVMESELTMLALIGGEREKLQASEAASAASQITDAQNVAQIKIDAVRAEVAAKEKLHQSQSAWDIEYRTLVETNANAAITTINDSATAAMGSIDKVGQAGKEALSNVGGAEEAEAWARKMEADLKAVKVAAEAATNAMYSLATSMAEYKSYGDDGWFGWAPVGAMPTVKSPSSTLPASADTGTWTPQSTGARAAGGPVTGNSPYLVGETGPEIFVPQTAGQVVNVQMAKGANTFNYPIMNDPIAMDRIGALVGDAIMARLKRSGVRF